MKSCNNDDESTSEPCSTMCGICPTCAFAPDPPGSTRCLWSASDEFKRKFITGLILRCTSIQVLRNVQDALSVTSWSLFTYARSKSQTWRPDYLSRSTDRALHGKPLGTDVSEIWDWFTNSPDWTKSRYLLRLFSFCDSELLRMVANLSNVLLVRQKRGFLQSNASSSGTIQHDQDKDEDSEDPELMVVPGASKSMSGVKRYVDFISCLPVDLSSRILGLLDIQTLRRCQKVCQMWQYLAQETLEEIKFRRNIQEQIKATMVKYAPMKIVDPTYANVVDVPIPLKEEETVDQSVQKVHFFEAPYAKIPTKTVQMEERNVYCGTYFTTVLLKKEDPYRVLDYRGGSLMAVGSKDRALHLLYVGTEIKVVTVLKGHVGSIRAVLLCEDRDLVITASCDSSIRCWSLKTDRCLMMLYGHTGTVNCLDVHADKLVSGAKDRLVKVWSLQTGKHNEKLNFKHPGSVRCVRINSTTVYSSCERGMVKLWDLEKASLLRVIDAHRSSVKCLFLDEWHFLSGDVEGQVMAWSVNSEVKPCLMTFKHPKEVKSLTLVNLRVVTGCADGKVRVFNFLTGDCLKTIPAEAEIAGILSMHFHDNGILVNSKSSIKRLQFAKVFWDYTAEAIQGAVVEKSTISPRKHPDHTAKVASPSQKVDDGITKEKVRAELPYHTCILCTPGKRQAQEKDKNVKPSVVRSEKATSERIEKRGPHHPLTQDSILLKVSAIQRAQCRDEVSVNMEHNASFRDFWGPVVAKTPQPPQLQSLKQSTHTHRYQTFQEGQSKKANTCVPMLKRAVSQDVTNAKPDCVRPHRSLVSIESSEAPLENKREGRNL